MVKVIEKAIRKDDCQVVKADKDENLKQKAKIDKWIKKLTDEKSVNWKKTLYGALDDDQILAALQHFM